MHGVSHMWYTCTSDVICFVCIMDGNKDVCHVCCPTYTISYAHHGKAWSGTVDTFHKQVVTGWMCQWFTMCLSHLIHAVGCAWFAYEWYSMSNLWTMYGRHQLCNIGSSMYFTQDGTHVWCIRCELYGKHNVLDASYGCNVISQMHWTQEMQYPHVNAARCSISMLCVTWCILCAWCLTCIWCWKPNVFITSILWNV